MRGGLWSSFSLLGAGTEMSVELNCVAGQTPPGIGIPAGFAALGGVACTPLQVKPASNSWSALKGTLPTFEATRETEPFAGVVPRLPGQVLNDSTPKQGVAPATSPLSYRQLKPTQGSFFEG